MKIRTQASVSRCEAGNMDARIKVTVDSGSSYNNREPVLGAIDHAIDGARKAIVAVMTEDRKAPR